MMKAQQPILQETGLPPFIVWEIEWSGCPVQVEYVYWLAFKGKKWINGRVYAGPGDSTKDGGKHKIPEMAKGK